MPAADSVGRMSAFADPGDWVRPRPDALGYRRDVVGALVLLVGSVVSLLLYLRIGTFPNAAEPWVSAIVVVGLSIPLMWRRRYPEAVAIVVSLAFFLGQTFLVPEVLISNITLFLAIYSVGAWSQHRRVATVTRIAIIIAMFLWIGVTLVGTVADPELMPGISRSGVFSAFAAVAVIQIITNLLYFGAAYYFGNTAFAGARTIAELNARTAELASERERSAQQAVALDRVSIARELHDVVAHHVSVMGVQAGAARRVLSSDPAQASSSLSTIEASARNAVDELQRLLTTLRDSDPDAANSSSSTRSIDQLPSLIDETVAAGVPARLQVIGEVRPVTTLVGFTLYRIAQEALTNTRKHGGERATADVRLRFGDDTIELEVTDTGIGRSLSKRGSGLGHIGMRERVAAVGGTLQVGPRSSGGYLVRATLPSITEAVG